ncbi:MAG: hypothetical protein KDJ88_08345 [Bauldia sp.]|nr:hypothetical protein [Bauldia sp.]
MARWTTAAIFALFGVLGATSLQAETIGYGEAIRTLTSACGADLQRNCSGVKPGGGAIQACMAKHKANVSENCIATVQIVFQLIDQRAKAQEAAPSLCANDARRMCSDFREGNARILSCLIRPDINRGVSKKCKQALIDAGWN